MLTPNSDIGGLLLQEPTELTFASAEYPLFWVSVTWRLFAIVPGFWLQELKEEEEGKICPFYVT